MPRGRGPAMSSSSDERGRSFGTLGEDFARCHRRSGMRPWPGSGAPAFFLPRWLDSTISICVGNGCSRCRTPAHRGSDLPGGLHLAALLLLLCDSTQVLWLPPPLPMTCSSATLVHSLSWQIVVDAINTNMSSTKSL
jgi:hypothetical protein